MYLPILQVDLVWGIGGVAGGMEIQLLKFGGFNRVNKHTSSFGAGK